MVRTSSTPGKARHYRHVVCACLAMCAPALAHAQVKRPNGELVYGETPPNVGRLNPHASISHSGPTDRVLSMIYEPLFRFNFNSDSWENVLGAAVAPTTPRKGKSAFVVTLAQALWHDNTPLKPADVVFTYKYIANASANQLEREQYSAQYVDVREGPGSNQVTFEFRDSVPDARYRLLDFIIPASKFDQMSYQPLSDATRLDANPIGTGPFKLDRFQNGDPVMSQFDKYHGTKANLATIRTRVYTDPVSMVQTLNTARGDIQMIVETPPEMLSNVEGNGGNNTGQLESYNVYAIALRQNPDSKLQSEKVRRALTMAVNRRLLLANWFVGKGQVLAGPVVPRAPYYDASVKEIPYDSAQARKILKDEGATGKKLVFIYPISDAPTANRTSSAVHAIKEALEAVGMKVEEKPLRQPQYEQALFRTGDFDLAWVRWEFNPAYDITPFFHSSFRKVGGSNYMNFSDQTVDRLLNEYTAANDPGLRGYVMRSLQKVINEKAPAIFLVNEETTYAYRAQYRLPVGSVDPFYFFTYAAVWSLGSTIGK